MKTTLKLPLAIICLGALTACEPTVKIEPPDKPIEINLNIRIEHEIRVQVERELNDLFSDNPDLFGIPSEGGK